MACPDVALTTRVHTGPWEVYPHLGAASRRLRRTVLSGSGVPVRLYYLMDGRGRRVGTISAPAGRPELGRYAPTVYLRRT
jgi:hypothetical protein